MKYGQMNEWITEMGPHLIEWMFGETLEHFWPSCSRNTAIRVGNGRKVHFWHNNWLGHSLRRYLFPLLYNLAQCAVYQTSAESREGNGSNILSEEILTTGKLEKLQIFSTFDPQFLVWTTVVVQLIRRGQAVVCSQSAYVTRCYSEVLISLLLAHGRGYVKVRHQ